MEEVIARIKGYVKTLYPDLIEELELSDDQFDLIVNIVIDRALVFMGREQLVNQYEEDIVDYPIEDEGNKDFWASYEANYGYPIHPRIEKVLAQIIGAAMRTFVSQSKEETGRVKSVSDQGQNVTYQDDLIHYFSSGNDSEIFASGIEILKRYKIPSIVPNEDS